MPYVDFAQVKERYRVEQVADLLGVTFKKKGAQWHADCPRCKSSGALSVNTDKQSFFCRRPLQGGRSEDRGRVRHRAPEPG